MTPVPLPTYCEHGRIIGWHHADDPDVIVSVRMTAPCPHCDPTSRSR